MGLRGYFSSTPLLCRCSNWIPVREPVRFRYRYFYVHCKLEFSFLLALFVARTEWKYWLRYILSYSLFLYFTAILTTWLGRGDGRDRGGYSVITRDFKKYTTRRLFLSINLILPQCIRMSKHKPEKRMVFTQVAATRMPAAYILETCIHRSIK